MNSILSIDLIWSFIHISFVTQKFIYTVLNMFYYDLEGSCDYTAS